MHMLLLSGFCAALFAPLIRRFVGRPTASLLALLPLAQTVYLLSCLPTIPSGQSLAWSYPWVPSLGLSLALRLDGLSALFALLITSIGAVVVLYSGDYLKDHAREGLFYTYLLTFSSSMLGLVLADNLLTLYLFWELTSLTSYLLIGFEHEEAKARAAAWQALLVTSGGGLAMLAGFLLLAQAGGTYELSALVEGGSMLREHHLYGAIVLLIFIGAMTKSAQWPFHFWLPTAMEAPTPVSAYLHSATMVKAGVYLLARLSPVLGGTELWTGLLVSAGLLTMVMGAALALPQRDIKLILAYATVSVLGMFVMLLGLGTELAVQAVMTYLVAHALYKGALFLAAGILDHASGTRDVTALSGLGKVLPGTAAGAGLAALSMAGLPPLLGYIGKEMAYDAAAHAAMVPLLFTAATVFAGLCFVATAGITGIHPFVGRRGRTPKDPHPAPGRMLVGPVLLGLSGVLFGVFSSWLEKPLISPAVAAVLREKVPITLSLWHGWTLPVLLSGVSLVTGLWLYWMRKTLRRLYDRASDWLGWGPACWYDVAHRVLTRIAKAQTALWQHGYLRYYLLAALLTGWGFSGYALVSGEGLHLPQATPTHFYEIAVALLIVISACWVTTSHSRLASVAALAGVGYGMTLVFVIFGAPDLALTQVLVETLMVVLFAYVLYRMPARVRLSSRGVRSRDAIVAVLMGGLMTALVLAAERLPLHHEVARYYVNHAVSGAHAHNIVNAILVDFRSFDTLGETLVLATAGIGVYALLKLQLDGRRSQ